jgi:hypothetical protein
LSGVKNIFPKVAHADSNEEDDENDKRYEVPDINMYQ